MKKMFSILLLLTMCLGFMGSNFTVLASNESEYPDSIKFSKEPIVKPLVNESEYPDW